jgi:hypothetical protein
VHTIAFISLLFFGLFVYRLSFVAWAAFSTVRGYVGLIQRVIVIGIVVGTIFRAVFSHIQTDWDEFCGVRSGRRLLGSG